MSKVVLCILDGFGIGDVTYKYNAVFTSHTPNFQRFLREYPNALLQTSGEAVGLPHGQMGNSEVGHMAIGSGRVVYQDLPRIDHSIKNGELETKLKELEAQEKIGATVHLVGLCSNGGVHSSLEHVIYIYKTLQRNGKNVILHIITDGRDVPPKAFQESVSAFDGIKIGTVAGRFFAMDRDNKLERTSAYFDCLRGKAKNFKTLDDVISDSYSKNITDEFIEPGIINDFKGIEQGDTLFIANFRADRVRQITQTAIESKIFGSIICMTEYSDEIASKTEVLFSKNFINNTLIDVLEQHNKKHLHIAETEKYAHVTFFFNGGKETLGKNEERIMIPSPSVKTYDMQPEMSIYKLQEKLLPEIQSSQHDFIVINIANGDMVGHTGNFEASKKAAEHIDLFLGRLEAATLKAGYDLLITADHGNLEEMIDVKTKDIHTQHTTGPVPVILVSKRKLGLKNGTLADIAATVLELMDIKVPEEMSESLL